MKLRALLIMLALSASWMTAAAQYTGPVVTSPSQITTPLPVITTDQSILYPSLQEFHLSPGDTVAIHLFDQADYAPAVRIGTDGEVLLPFLGSLHIAGLTIDQTEELVSKKLIQAGLYVDPQVTVQVTEGPNAFVTVVGETHGLVPVIGTRRLFDVIAAAGGLPITASHVITINRPGLAQPIVVDLGIDPAQSALANIPVFPGDTVITGRTGVVYVVGAFKTGGPIPLTQATPLTLLQAAALSGGPVYEAKYDDLHLIRTIGNQRTVVKLNIQKIMYGQAPDPILQANDVLFLPSSALKAVIANGGASAILSFASLAISAYSITH